MRRAGARNVFAFAALFSLWDGDGMRDALSWWGFSTISGILFVLGVVLLVQERARARALLLSWSAAPTLGFMALCLASTAWSAYPLETALCWVIQLVTATVAVAMVAAVPWRRLAVIFALMLQVHLVLALVFEVVVAFTGPVLPFFTDYGSNVPGAYYWSLGLIFHGGRIQGIVGNANLTCFIALLALVTTAVLARAKAVRPALLVAAAVLDLVVVALTRSATVLVAAGMVTVSALIVLGFRRFGRRGRVALAAGGVLSVGLVAVGSSRLFEPALRILGKGDDLTGRFEIWRIVGILISERPVTGWGWVGWWVPWVYPFDGRVIRAGVQYLQAHNAYLDVQLQLGIPGLIALVLLVGSAVYRSLLLALVPRPWTLLPLLLVVALLTQALAESRLLIEGNWALLVMLSIAVPAAQRSLTRLRPRSPERGGARQLVSE